jgi:hypothetical protein
MSEYNEEKFDLLVDEIQSGRLNRREFFRRCALLGVSLTTVVQVLDATKVQAAAATEFPPNWDPYPFKWGTNPIADNPDDAIKWYLARMKDSAVPDTDPRTTKPSLWSGKGVSQQILTSSRRGENSRDGSATTD